MLFHANKKEKMTIEKEIDIGNDVWGHAYEIELQKEIKSEKEVFELLDKFCSAKKLNELKNTWIKIEFSKAKKLFKDCLTYDIAYSSSRISEPETVEKIFINTISKLNTKEIKFCYTNCFGTPWEQIRNGYGFNSITEQTFDIGIVILDNEKLLFAYFMSED